MELNSSFKSHKNAQNTSTATTFQSARHSDGDSVITWLLSLDGGDTKAVLASVPHNFHQENRKIDSRVLLFFWTTSLKVH